MSNDDRRIDELIRALRRDDGDEGASVSDDVLYAYLEGRATAAEKSEVRRALANSQQFRREVVDLVQYLETLQTNDAAAAFDAAAAPPFVAPRRVAEPVVEPGPSLLERLVAAVQWLVETPRVLITAPATAALVLALTIAPRLSYLPSATMTDRERLPARAFSGPLTGESRGAESHDVAAEEELRRCVRLNAGGQLVFTAAPTQELPVRIATIHLVSSWRRKLRTVDLHGTSPPDVSSGADGPDMRLWLALLPATEGGDIEVRIFALEKDSAAIRWASETRSRAIVLVTYRTGGEFQATPCVLVDFTD